MDSSADVTLSAEDEAVILMLSKVTEQLRAEGASPEHVIKILVEHGCDESLAEKLVEITFVPQSDPAPFLLGLLKANPSLLSWLTGAASFLGAAIAVCGFSWIASFILSAISASAGNNEFLSICVELLKQFVGVGIGLSLVAWTGYVGSRPVLLGSIFGILSYYVTMHLYWEANRW